MSEQASNAGFEPPQMIIASPLRTWVLEPPTVASRYSTLRRRSDSQNLTASSGEPVVVSRTIEFGFNAGSISSRTAAATAEVGRLRIRRSQPAATAVAQHAASAPVARR